jgi:hypothetical protein
MENIIQTGEFTWGYDRRTSWWLILPEERETTPEELELLYTLTTTKQLAMDERAALMKASMRLTEAQKVAAFFASVIKSGEGWSDTCQDMLDSI